MANDIQSSDPVMFRQYLAHNNVRVDLSNNKIKSNINNVISQAEYIYVVDILLISIIILSLIGLIKVVRRYFVIRCPKRNVLDIELEIYLILSLELL